MLPCHRYLSPLHISIDAKKYHPGSLIKTQPVRQISYTDKSVQLTTMFHTAPLSQVFAQWSPLTTRGFPLAPLRLLLEISGEL